MLRTEQLRAHDLSEMKRQQKRNIYKCLELVGDRTKQHRQIQTERKMRIKIFSLQSPVDIFIICCYYLYLVKDEREQMSGQLGTSE